MVPEQFHLSQVLQGFNLQASSLPEAALDSGFDYTFYVDAAMVWGAGAILARTSVSGIPSPQYTSRQFTKVELNHAFRVKAISTTFLEALGVAFLIQSFRHLLQHKSAAIIMDADSTALAIEAADSKKEELRHLVLQIRLALAKLDCYARCAVIKSTDNPADSLSRGFRTRFFRVKSPNSTCLAVMLLSSIICSSNVYP